MFLWKRITILVTEHDDDKVVLVFCEIFDVSRAGGNFVRNSAVTMDPWPHKNEVFEMGIRLR